MRNASLTVGHETQVGPWDDPSRGFLLVWGFVGIGAIMLFELLRPRLSSPNAAMIVVGVAWLAVLLREAALQDRHQALRDREAADLAAKARGEANVDRWQEV